MPGNTANDAVLAEGRRVLIEDPHWFYGVRVTGAGEHCWRYTRRGDKYVTVITGLTPIRANSDGMRKAGERRLNRDELYVNPGCFRKCAQVAGIRGEDVVAVGCEAYHSGISGVGLATAGKQHPSSPRQRVIDGSDGGAGQEPGHGRLPPRQRSRRDIRAGGGWRAERKSRACGPGLAGYPA